MLTEYQLTNFKAFGETVTIPIRPITLIFGPNSSGKSSILQSLRLFKQSFEKNPKLESITHKGGYIDTGGFKEFIHGHDETRNFSIRMTYDGLVKTAASMSDDLWCDYFSGQHPEMPSEYKIEADQDDHDIFYDAFAEIKFNRLAILKSFQLDASTQKIPLQYESIFLGDDSLDLFLERIAGDDWHLIHDHECLKKILEYLNGLHIPNRLAAIYKYMAEELLEGTFSSIEYIPPLRDYPLRYYDLNEPSEYLNLHTNPENFAKTNEWLQRLGTGCILDQIESWNVIYELSKTLVGIAPRIINRDSKTRSSIADVGFGISQLLPIITKSMALKNSNILIEQPEIHLHPALQAEMGDLFINSALGEQKNTFLIETHSEHLLLRIMRRMRETFNDKLLNNNALPVTPKDVAILFVQPNGAASSVRQLELDEEGQLLDPWPGGFFEEGFRERFA